MSKEAPPKPRPWTVRREEKLGDFRVFSVTALHSHRGGQDHTFFRIDAPDWVNVVALAEDGRFILVRQFRHGAAAQTLEIPGGMVDAGESPERAAARELEEETGFRAHRMEKIGVVNPNPALFPNTLHTFLARGCRKVSEVANDAHEETVVELVDRAQLDAHIAAGEVDHALVLAALFWLSRDEDSRHLGAGSPTGPAAEKN